MKLKKLLSLLLSVSICMSMLVSCTNDDSSSKADSSSSSVTDSSSVADESSETDDSSRAPSVGDTLQDMRDISSAELVKEMKTGWNLGNTLDAIGNPTVGAETHWQKVPTTKELITFLKEGGFNVLRIPVSWGEHMDENYVVDEAWMQRVREIVDYGIENDMYVILNTHHEEWYFPNEENKAQDIEQLTALWSQIAEEFKNYDEHLIFEGLNEPRLRGTQYEWNGGNAEGQKVVAEYAQAFYNTVRNSGGNNPKRHLMLTGYAASSNRMALSKLWFPENDDKVIVSVHAYLPYSFALDTKGTDEFGDGNKGEIDSFFDTLYDKFTSKGIPVIVGEYGSVNKMNTEERIECVTYYLTKAKEQGIPCIWWDNNAIVGNGENFGIVDRTFPQSWRFEGLVDAIMAVYDE